MEDPKVLDSKVMGKIMTKKDSESSCEESPLRKLKKEAFSGIESLEKSITSLKKKNKIYTAINYTSLAISLMLDFAPAFIESLQSTWYSIPTVSFSMITLLINIHLDKESYEKDIQKKTMMKTQLGEIVDSINRKNRKRSGEPSEDYVKRLQTKLNSVNAS